jgi:hypothetical protein
MLWTFYYEGYLKIKVADLKKDLDFVLCTILCYDEPFEKIMKFCMMKIKFMF